MSGLTIISGDWGTGKSKYLVELMERDWNHNVYTISNFPCAFASMDLSKDSPEMFLWKLGMYIEMKMKGIQIGHFVPGYKMDSLSIYMDEGTLYFSPEMQDKMRKGDEKSYERFKVMLAQVRHFNINIFIACQDISRLGKDLRSRCDDYIHLRHLINLPYYVYSYDEEKQTYREELRNRIRIQWVEHHMVPADSPQFNYRQVVDPRTNRLIPSQSSTLVGKPRMHWDYGKDYLYDMYHSYSTGIGLGRSDEAVMDFNNVNFDFILKDSCYIPRGYKRERLPTIKRWLRKLGIKVKINDEFPPVKIYFEDLKFPVESYNRNKDSIFSNQERLLVNGIIMQQYFYKANYERRVVASSQVLKLARSLHVDTSDLKQSDIDGTDESEARRGHLGSFGFKSKVIDVEAE